ncbi:MAG TPA: serine/threonine-protein kinase [Gemmataceae bacterium]
MASTSHVDRELFLAYLRESGLVAPAALERALEQVPESDRGRVVARSLVEQGLLTRFQAERLLVGLTQGFFLGQYLILDEIGKGGMGRVFKARHQTMGRIVALKILAAKLTDTPRARELFQREVLAAARLVHPNIVTAYDANESGGRHFLVMEFVDGPNLQELVRKKGPLPVGQACDIIRQAAAGLQYAHELGMVHRDIKPSNILLQPETRPNRPPSSTAKILDFGLARLGEPGSLSDPALSASDSFQTPPHTVTGTPDYLSPEQARNIHSADGRSDLYSLGCTFYYLLTGRVPFPGGTAMEKLIRHGTEEPVPLEQLRADVPRSVALIVRRMMAKDPARRYATADDLIADLQGLDPTAPEIWIAVPAAGEDVMPLEDPPSTGPIPRRGRQGRDSPSLFEEEGETAAPATHPVSAAPTHVSPRTRRARRLRRSYADRANAQLWAVVAVLVAILLGFAAVVYALSRAGALDRGPGGLPF